MEDSESEEYDVHKPPNGDWWSLRARLVTSFSVSSFLQTMRALTKRSVLFVPGFGPLLWAFEFLFLTRNFAKDEMMIKRASEGYKEYPFPIQVRLV